MKFATKDGKVWLRDICLEELAGRFGTPYYLYDLDMVKERIAGIRQAFGDSVELLYAMKANPNEELLRGICGAVDGVDVASGGETRMAIDAGYQPSSISFAGPGKTRDELRQVLEARIGFLSVESFRELREIEDLVEAGAPRANILLRVNPKLLIKEFAIKMGGKASQFGIDEEDLPMALDIVRARPEVFDFHGLHIYSGTQCLSEEHLAQNLSNTLDIAAFVTNELRMPCRVINIGGGFGVAYHEEQKGIDLQKLAGLFKAEIKRYQERTETVPRVVLELGRYLVAEAGIYVARVISEKKSRGELFFILDGGMNHHLAASGNLGATIRKNYQVRNLSRADAPLTTCNLVGPLCTPLDLMGKDVSVETPAIGDLIGFLFSGSYGFSASPLRFLGHDEPREIVVGSSVDQVQ